MFIHVLFRCEMERLCSYTYYFVVKWSVYVRRRPISSFDKIFQKKMTVYPDYNFMEVLARIALTAGNKRARPRI